MPGEIQNLGDILKTAYAGKRVNTVINEELVFRPRLKAELPPGAKITEGWTVVFGAKLDPMNRVAQIQDGGTLPQGGESKDRQFIMKPTLFTGVYSIGVMARAAIKSSKVSFSEGTLQAQRAEEIMGNMGKFIESTYVGTAGDGIRGYVESGVNATSVILANPIGVELVREGYDISFRRAGAVIAAASDKVRVTAVDPATRTITHNGDSLTVPLVLNDAVYVVAEQAQTLTATFANGLRGQVDDGTVSQFIHTLDRTTAANVKLKSIVDDPGAPENMTEEKLLTPVLMARKYTGKTPTTVLMGPGQVGKYAAMVAPQRRFPVTGKGRQTMTTGVRMEDMKHDYPGGSLEFVLSFDVIPREMYGICWDTMFFYSALDAQWLGSEDGGILQLVPGAVAGSHRALWVAYLASVENWGTDMPRANIVWRNLRDKFIGDS